MTKPRWTRFTANRDYSYDGYRLDDRVEITDNGGGPGKALAGRWALMVEGRWVANYNKLTEAKAAGEEAAIPCAGEGVGYFECDQQGCPGCREIAESIEDWDQILAWNEERKAIRDARPMFEAVGLITVEV